MPVEWLVSLYAYGRWANARVLESAAHISAGDLLADHGPGARPVRDTLAHTMLTQRWWLDRWRGDGSSSMGDPATYRDLASIRDEWLVVEEETTAFLKALDDEQLLATIRYRSSRGLEFAHQLWEVLLQQANHATQHRSEAAYLLSQLGHSPGNLDYVIYLDGHQR